MGASSTWESMQWAVVVLTKAVGATLNHTSSGLAVGEVFSSAWLWPSCMPYGWPRNSVGPREKPSLFRSFSAKSPSCFGYCSSLFRKRSSAAWFIALSCFTCRHIPRKEKCRINIAATGWANLFSASSGLIFFLCVYIKHWSWTRSTAEHELAISMRTTPTDCNAAREVGFTSKQCCPLCCCLPYMQAYWQEAAATHTWSSTKGCWSNK